LEDIARIGGDGGFDRSFQRTWLPEMSRLFGKVLLSHFHQHQAVVEDRGDRIEDHLDDGTYIPGSRQANQTHRLGLVG